jgi:hypothetical protein
MSKEKMYIEVIPASEYEVNLDIAKHNGVSLQSGLSVYNLTAGSFSQTKKLVLLKKNIF